MPMCGFYGLLVPAAAVVAGVVGLTLSATWWLLAAQIVLLLGAVARRSRKSRRPLLLGQIEVAVRLAANGDRDAQESPHRRVPWREPYKRECSATS